MQYSYLYILASRKDGALYVGVTANLVKRVYEHREKLIPSHTAKYNITKLVWYEVYEDITEAILREKQMKAWKRNWKIELIEKNNHDWKDLYEDICQYSVIPAKAVIWRKHKRDSCLRTNDGLIRTVT